MPDPKRGQITSNFAYIKQDEKLYCTGVALAEGIWDKAFYTADVVEKSTPDLIDKPIIVDHGRNPDFGRDVVGKFIDAWYDEALKASIVKFVIDDPRAIKLIEEEGWTGLSVTNFIYYNKNDRGIEVVYAMDTAEMSLCDDPMCSVCHIITAKKQLSKLMERDRKGHLLDEVLDVSARISELSEETQKEEYKEYYNTHCAILHEKAVWSYSFVKSLPASSFAVPGKRKLPYKGKGGALDAAHVRNALARLPQTKGLTAEEKASAYRKLCAAARKLKIRSKVCETRRKAYKAELSKFVAEANSNE